MTCHHLIFIVILFGNFFYFSQSERPCKLENLFTCFDEESCEQLNATYGVCKCRKGYQRTDATEHCKPIQESEHSDVHPALPTPESVFSHGSSASALAAGLLIPLFLIALVAALIFAAKKYRWLQKIREQAHQLRVRNYDTVLVNQEDDPPIA